MNNVSILPPNKGKIISIAPANPATGANFTFAVPVHTIILPISFSCIFNTDATVSSRVMVVGTFDGARNSFQVASPITQTAGMNLIYHMQAGGNLLSTSLGFAFQQLNLSGLNFLRFGDSFNTLIYNLQAGDSITSPYFKYMQWIQE